MLYNDGYKQILGAKHPAAWARPDKIAGLRSGTTIRPMLGGVLERGEATWSDDLLLLLERNGYPEECYFTFSYSPIRDESGGIGGVFTPVNETTERVIGVRRLRTFRDLAARKSDARSEEQTWSVAAQTIAENPYDLPFAVLYKLSAGQRHPRTCRNRRTARWPLSGSLHKFQSNDSRSLQHSVERGFEGVPELLEDLSAFENFA